MRQIYTRENGEKFLFDPEEWEFTTGQINEAISILKKVPALLSMYEDTREKSHDPDYVAGVLKGGFNFIRKEREERLRKAIKGLPFGKSAIERMIAETLEEIPQEIEKGLEDIEREKAYIDRGKLLDNSVVSVTQEGEEIVLSLPANFMEDLRKKFERDIPEGKLEDIEKFREAIYTLWEIADRGAFMKSQFAFGQIYPSILSNLIEVNGEEKRKESLNDITLLQKLYGI